MPSAGHSNDSPLIALDRPIHVADIGAAFINEVPPYRQLIASDRARLTAFDGDERQIEAIRAAFGNRAEVRPLVLGDGKRCVLHLTSAASGMSSILAPSPDHLAFFNGFSAFGSIEHRLEVETIRLDDVSALAPIDYLKMDIQGAELMVLQNGTRLLADAVAIQLEVSFVPLYQDQPAFGDVDCWMRAHGFLPHCFVDVKCWSVSPSIRSGNFRVPWNQLLEADIVYFKDPVRLDAFSDGQLARLAVIAQHCYGSPDLSVRLLMELERRGAQAAGVAARVAAGALV